MNENVGQQPRARVTRKRVRAGLTALVAVASVGVLGGCHFENGVLVCDFPSDYTYQVIDGQYGQWSRSAFICVGPIGYDTDGNPIYGP